jgi:NADP-dependent 3-hydroxy acid dehydrogenase YdfG
MSTNFVGKVVVITGASSGLGEALLACSQRRAQASRWVRGVSIALSRLRTN